MTGITESAGTARPEQPGCWLCLQEDFLRGQLAELGQLVLPEGLDQKRQDTGSANMIRGSKGPSELNKAVREARYSCYRKV